MRHIPSLGYLFSHKFSVFLDLQGTTMHSILHTHLHETHTKPWIFIFSLIFSFSWFARYEHTPNPPYPLAWDTSNPWIFILSQIFSFSWFTGYDSTINPPYQTNLHETYTMPWIFIFSLIFSFSWFAGYDHTLSPPYPLAWDTYPAPGIVFYVSLGVFFSSFLSFLGKLSKTF